MKTFSFGTLSVIFFGLLFLFSCQPGEKKTARSAFTYEHFKDSVIRDQQEDKPDSVNMFDSPAYTPGVDSLELLLVRLDTLLHRQAALMRQLDTMKKGVKKTAGFTEEEKAIIRENINTVDSFLMAKKDSSAKISCQGKDCMLYAEVDKSKQLLYLYIFGNLEDSFKVSTGKGKKYETPAMSLHPRGPLLIKYTSRKFPGGNYMGLGNMPFAVFVKGGYAIHGTTPGNYVKLGSKASHGCIRLHPDNAKVFHALVKTVGLNQTWVTIKDSLP